MKNAPETIKNKTPSVFNRDPYRDFLGLQSQMDSLFNELWNSGGLNVINRNYMPSLSFNADFAPSADLDETDTHYLLTFDIPGMKKDDIKIDVRDNVITISGERKDEYEQKRKSSYRSERYVGSFSRSIGLPLAIKADQIEAQYNDGVLKIAAPKAEATKVKQVKIGEGKGDFLEKYKTTTEKH